MYFMKKLILVVFAISISTTAFSMPESDMVFNPTTGLRQDREKIKPYPIEADLQKIRSLRRKMSWLEERYLIKLEKAPVGNHKKIKREFQNKVAKVRRKLNHFTPRALLKMSKSKYTYECGDGKLFEKGKLMVCEDGSQWRKSGASIYPNKAHIQSGSRNNNFKPLYEGKNVFPYSIPQRGFQK